MFNILFSHNQYLQMQYPGSGKFKMHSQWDLSVEIPLRVSIEILVVAMRRPLHERRWGCDGYCPSLSSRQLSRALHMQASHYLAPVSLPDRCPEHYTCKFRSSDDGHSIIITEYINEHNHDISQALYNLIPAQRRLEQPDKNKAGPWFPLMWGRSTRYRGYYCCWLQQNWRPWTLMTSESCYYLLQEDCLPLSEDRQSHM